MMASVQYTATWWYFGAIFKTLVLIKTIVLAFADQNFKSTKAVILWIAIAGYILSENIVYF